jgi:hypothetical protein
MEDTILGMFGIIVLSVSAFNLMNNKKEKFTFAANDEPAPKLASGPSLADTQALQGYQNNVLVNTGTNGDQINQMGANYYSTLQNYLNPSMQNLQLAQNVYSGNIMGTAGLTGPPPYGATSSYSDSLGNGYVDNLGYLNGESFPPVAYSNDRASELSKCAKDLPMFAASSLLPKPSTNADNNALSQSAARALAAYTALSPVEQIGAITSINTPYSKTSDVRALSQLPQSSMVTPLFNASSSTYISPTYGQFNSNTDRVGPSGLY